MLKKVLYQLIILSLIVQIMSSSLWVKALGDETPPVTTINIDGGSAGLIGTYFGYAEVHLSAIDDASGVQAIEYSSNDGTTWEFYTMPVRLDTPGSYTFKYRSTDTSGNQEIEQVQVIDIKPDLQSPITTSSLSGQIGDGPYYSDSVTVNLTATDMYSGVKLTEYSMDNGISWLPYLQPIILTETGTHILIYRSIDQSGNVEKSNSLIINLDSMPPTSPMIMFNAAGWTKDNVMATLSDGQDYESGALKSQFKFGEQASWLDYSIPFEITVGTTVYARTLDFAGNISDIAYEGVKIDKNSPTAPSVRLGYEDWTDDDVWFAIDHGMDSGSLVYKSQYQIGSGEWIDYNMAEYVVDEGETQVHARTLDNAGNISGESSAVVKIDRTPPSAPIIEPSTAQWTNTDVTLSIANGIDLLSGPLKSQYSIGEIGDWFDYSIPITISQEGETLIKARTIDYVGNIGEESTIWVRIDKTLPTSPIILSSSTNWTNQDVVVSIENGTDELSGVKGSQYKLGSTGSWIDYLAPVTISQEGETTFYARTVDLAGNNSLEASVMVKIDKTPPSTPGPIFIKSKTSSTVHLNWGAASDNIAVSSYDVYNDNILIGSSQSTSFLATGLTPNKLHSFSIRAKDLAGNESAASQTLELFTSDPLISSLRSNFAIKNNGTVFSWGENQGGKLSDGTMINRLTASPVSNLNGFISISSGANHAIGLKTDGSVWAWGSNSNGNLANPALNNSYTPIIVSQLDSVSAVSSGLVHSLVLKDDGSVWGWGGNGSGQLGNGITDTPAAPVQTNISSVVAISASYYHSLALKNDGSVWAWGSNGNGQLGNGTTVDSSQPIQVSNLNQIVAVSASPTHSIALKRDGSVWAWGNVNVGPLGNGALTGSSIPVQVVDIGNIVGISSGYNHDLALDKDGRVWAWGTNTYGQLGDGTTIDRKTPVQVSHVDSVTSISAGDAYNLVTRKDGTVWAWGWNYNGELGNGTLVDAKSRVQVTGLGTNPNDVVQPAVPILTVTGKTSTTAVLSWTESTDNFAIAGYNLYKGTELIATTSVDSKPSIEARTFTVTNLTPGTTYSFTTKARDMAGNLSLASNLVTITTDISLPSVLGAGYNYSLTIKTDGSLWGWGNNSSGQIGDNGTYDYYRTYPAAVGNVNSMISISAGPDHVLALKSDGTVWAWGNNQSGQLGDGTGMNRRNPIQVPGLQSIMAISSGTYHSLALKSDGTVWAWGNNSFGQLGLGYGYGEYSPVQIPNLSNVKSISAGFSHSLAVTNSGSLYVWGDNMFGQLGDGTTTSRLTPYLINTISDIKQADAGDYFSQAVTNGGALYGWGNNNYGSVGDGSNTNKYYPVLVANQVSKVSVNSNHSVALKSDGTVWTWGFGAYGQLGNGGTYNTNAPVMLTGLTSATDVAAGYMHSGAITSNGNVWSWGDGSSGQLGNGSTLSSKVPVESLFQGTFANRTSTNKHNEVGSGEVMLMPPPVDMPEFKDTLAPTTPKSLMIGTQLVDSIMLVWEKSEDNVAIEEYVIYSDMELIATTKLPQFIINKLDDDKIRTYTIRAIDGSGNMSGVSNPLSVFP